MADRLSPPSDLAAEAAAEKLAREIMGQQASLQPDPRARIVAEAYLALCEREQEAAALVQRFHDECSVLKSGERLNLGPMMEATERTVLDARAFLAAGRQAP